MSFSKEWTEWHLTPREWERGSERSDGVGVTTVPPPVDRVKTVRWLEEQTSGYGPMHRSHVADWNNGNKDEIQALMDRFGHPPQAL
jgi:hypothetical protein